SPPISVLETPLAIRSAVSSNGARETLAPMFNTRERAPAILKAPLQRLVERDVEGVKLDEWWVMPASTRKSHPRGCQRANTLPISAGESTAVNLADRTTYVRPTVPFHGALA